MPNSAAPPAIDLHAAVREASRADNAIMGDADFPLRETFFPLGFPIEVATNCDLVLEAAVQSWHMFSAARLQEPLRIELRVNEESNGGLPPAPVCRVRQHLVQNAADTDNWVVTDLKEGLSFGLLSRAAAESPLYLRYHFLEAAAMCMISALRAAPVHAACVAPMGRGMLLCGDSGAGKSSLAYAGARAGWIFTSDDASYLPMDSADRGVIGNCHQIRFRDTGVELFPELNGRPITPRAAGKPSIEVPTKEFPGLMTRESANIDYIIFLNRSNGSAAGLRRLSAQIAKNYFIQTFPFPPSDGSLFARSFQKLLEVDVFELRYTSLDWALDRLEQLAATGR